MPSRAVRRLQRIVSRCACAGALVGIRAIPAAAAPPPAWVRVVQDDDQGLELMLRAPEPQIGPEGVRVPGFASTGEAGLPVMFEAALSIAVPGSHGAKLDILEVNERDLGVVRPGIAPRASTPAERRAAGAAGKALADWTPVEAQPLTSAYPEHPVTLSGPARARGRDCVSLAYRPLQFRPDGTARYAAEVRVRITFADRAVLGPRLGAAIDPLHAAFLNAARAATWELATPSPVKPGAGAAATAAPSQHLRIRIPQRGIYELTYNDLLSAGVPLTGLDPRTFRLFFDDWKPIPLDPDTIPGSWQPGYSPHEASIWVPGEADGTFTSDDPNDKIVFYALGPEGYEDEAGTSGDSLAYFQHPYDKYNYGWLTWGGADFGARMDSTDVSVPDSTTAPHVDRVWHHEHHEQDLGFDAVDDLWYWEEVRQLRPLAEPFGCDLGGEAAAVGDLRVALGFADPSGRHVLDVKVGSQLLGRADFFTTGALARRFTYSNVALAASNTLSLSSVAGLDNALGTYFLEFDLGWTRPLVATPSGVLAWSARPAVVSRTTRHLSNPESAWHEVYALKGLGAQAPLLLDVTNPLRPGRLTGLTPSGSGPTTVWSALYGRGVGRRAHYFAVKAPTDVPGRDVALRTVAPLRARTSAPDMLIVTHESLRAAADRLAAYRRAHWPGGGTPDILVTTTADIYDEFSGGRMDPLAIRNYAKFLYNLDATPRLRYLLLFGDATHDIRQNLTASAATLVPTVMPGYLDPRYDRRSSVYAVEDWMGEFDRPQNSVPPAPVPEVAIGRLAARNLAEAQRLVDKIEAYETTSGYGTWRARVMMVADDECTPRGCGETFHIDNTEDLVRRIPPDLVADKFYETEYPAVLGQKPQARAAFIRSWSDGCVLLNFQGHGAPRQLTDEVLFLSTDVPSLTNGLKLPLFMAISCDVSVFDDPERQSMCEDLVASTAGGAIATLGATTLTYVSTNAPFNDQLFRGLFAGGATGREPLGVVIQMAKLASPIGNSEFNETYLLLGDPSLTLQLPQARVRFTAGTDSILTGQRARIEGEIVTATDSVRIAGFNGSVEVEVFGTDDTSGYSGTVHIAYDLPGSPIYRGSVPVTDGSFAFQFITPLGARPGSRGRLHAYAAAALDAQGARAGLTVRVGTAPDSSTGAPRIALRFPNDRTLVKGGTPLTAEIHDENGINIQGTSLRNSIYLDFDHKNEPLNVTSQFRYQAGSDSVGSVTVPIPSVLDPGPHTATLIASDNLQNTGTATVDFKVADSDVVQLVNVIAFPNPFRDWTRFFFEITDPADVEVEIFTLSGRPVWHHRERFETGAQESIKWDGVDLGEDTVANGTYIYRLRAHPDRAGSPILERIGKVVVMR